MSNIPKSFAEERDEAAELYLAKFGPHGKGMFPATNVDFWTVDKKAFLAGANWCLESSLVTDAMVALQRLKHWAIVADAKLCDADNWSGSLAIKKAEESLEAYEKAIKGEK